MAKGSTNASLAIAYRLQSRTFLDNLGFRLSLIHAATFMDLRAISQSIMLFVIAGLMEIGGGYLVWLWLRESRGWVLGAMGGLLLFLYGVVPTLQPAHFGRVYAAYGGVFVVLSILWGWWVDGVRPDRPEIVGALLCVVGVAVIMYWPRVA